MRFRHIFFFLIPRVLRSEENVFQETTPTQVPVCLPSKSQVNEENKLIKLFFKGLRNGVFVEIGAYDGITFSNTLKLETCFDWKGLLIEGDKLSFDRMKANAKKYRPRSILRHGAVCAPPQKFVNFAREGKATSGDLDIMAKFKKSRRWHDERRNATSGQWRSGWFDAVPCRTMAEYLSEASISHINFFSLDVEGSELEILMTIDFQRVNIDVLMIEEDKHSYSNTWKISNLLANLGFRLCPEGTVRFSRVFLGPRSPYHC